LEVVEGAFRSTAVNIIFAPVKGYAYLVWKPAVAKRWPGVFASTPPSPALTNPIEGKQASPTKVELVNKRIGVQLVHKPTPRAKPQSPSQPTEDQIQALMGDVSKLSDVEKRIRQYVVKKYRDRWKDVEPGRAMTASKDDKLYEEEVGLIHYSISTWRRALGRKPR
jgi:hypothetical protein